jgi:hypothetical protein
MRHLFVCLDPTPMNIASKGEAIEGRFNSC